MDHESLELIVIIDSTRKALNLQKNVMLVRHLFKFIIIVIHINFFLELCPNNHFSICEKNRPYSRCQVITDKKNL